MLGLHKVVRQDRPLFAYLRSHARLHRRMTQQVEVQGLLLKALHSRHYFAPGQRRRRRLIFWVAHEGR